jgi:hypothetical protein
MQGLHNRDSFLLADIVGGRRDEGERVVKMNEVWLHTSQQRTHFLCGIPGPKRTRRSSYAAQDAVLGDVTVVSNVFHDIVAGRPEQFPFAAKDHIFSSRVKITIVCKEQFHTASGRMQSARFMHQLLLAQLLQGSANCPGLLQGLLIKQRQHCRAKPETHRYRTGIELFPREP